MAKPPRFSIIIPSYDDGEFLLRNLPPLARDPCCEVLVVEAGSHSRLPAVCRVLKSPEANRAVQMNLGAKRARGEILLFLHADTLIDPESLDPLYQNLKKQKKYVGGCFQFALDHPSWRARAMEVGVMLRELFFRLPYGDQALFVRKEVFHELGGFPLVPVMEDVLLIRELQKRGRLLYFHHRAVTSARKWVQRGFFRTMFANWFAMFQLKRGVPLEQIAQNRRELFIDG